MLQISFLRENTQLVKDLLKVKNFKQIELIDQVIELDDNRKSLLKKLEDCLAESNIIAKEVGQLFKSGKASEAGVLKERAAVLKENSRNYDLELQGFIKQIEDVLVLIPNLPHKSVVFGKSADDNEIVESWGDINNFSDKLKPHWDINDELQLIDFEWGSKIAGSGFPVYKGKMAKFQRALIQYFLDQAVDQNYFEVQPPYLVNEDSGFATGQLPDKEGQMYHMTVDNLYLIPTAEVPVTNIYRNTILKHNEIPVRLTAYSACFRREAGSYGKDVRGLNRLHQFDKVEIVRIENPENSYEALDKMCDHVSSLIKSLGLPYRKLRLCGGDISFTAALTFDFEVYAAGQKRWLEVSSVSNFETYQSNRMKLRCKDTQGNTFIPHTLNGSALALPRIVAAIIENYQTEDGIVVPDVLVPYTGFKVLSNK